MKKQSNWVTALFLVAFLALVALAAYTYFSRYPELTSDNLERFISSFGPWAVAVYVLAYLLSSPIPFLAPILSATGGLLFGPALGATLAVLIAAATSLVPFTISRHLGREWVSAKLQGSRLNDLYKRLDRGGSGFTFVLLLRLVPVMPWELQNYLAGVTQVTVLTYLVATILGSIPLTVCLAILGAAVKNPASWQFVTALALTAVVLVTPILVFYIKNKKNPK
ncbi:MAG TPA: TVP38/TMEM64 family protein [Anaerolineaceae bacterium]|jgi:uncharacterized membrane protein YdjX (TVP38/TMEM64 family)